jgi:hypothetical protein|tara:strand:- start:1574 stop:1873 length:300 start_codon:yes stop_codon:yes gene_type:complete
MKTVHIRDIKCVNLEKHIIIEEQKVAKIMEENDKINRVLQDKTEALNKIINEKQNSLKNPRIISNRGVTEDSSHRSKFWRSKSDLSDMISSHHLKSSSK